MGIITMAGMTMLGVKVSQHHRGRHLIRKFVVRVRGPVELPHRIGQVLD